MTTMFESRVFWLPKDLDKPREYEDAFALDAERGRAAIADGVSSALFSGLWARMLTQAVVADAPDVANGFPADWLGPLRKDWIKQIDFPKLDWFKQEKLRQVGGAFTTLLWMELAAGPADTTAHGAGRLRCWALGDSCLFQVRDGGVVNTFPIQVVADFDKDPLTIPSRNSNKDHFLTLQALETDWRAGDLLVVCTDALAKWALTLRDEGAWPRWEDYWLRSEEEWQQEVLGLRQDGKIRVDDTTLVLLRLSGTPAAVPEAAAAPAAEAGVAEADRPRAEAEPEPVLLVAKLADGPAEPPPGVNTDTQ